MRVKPLREWAEKALVFIEDAGYHLEKGHYWLTCFEAQQAVKLYLKAILIALTGFYPFTHDLVELLDTLRELDINIPEELYAYADALTPYYTMARYPGKKPVKYSRSLGERCLRYARSIIKWLQENLIEKGN